MPSPRVLCLGEMLFDRLADQPAMSADAVQTWTDYPGGSPANVACALARLGTPAAFVGCLGQDERGDALMQVLTEAGVNTTAVQRHATAPTRTVEVLSGAEGGSSSEFRTEATTTFADTQFQASQLPVTLFEAAEYLVLGTVGLAQPETGQAIARALDLADQYYVKIFLDVNWRPQFWPDPDQATAQIEALLKRIDFLKLAEEEALWLFETDDPQTILQSLEQLEGVVVTQGQTGCRYAFSQGAVGRLPAFITAVQDVTGAGDSFVAALVHQLVEQGLTGLSDIAKLEAMLRYASAAGALTTMKRGAIAAQPTDAEIQTFLVGRVG